MKIRDIKYEKKSGERLWASGKGQRDLPVKEKKEASFAALRCKYTPPNVIYEMEERARTSGRD